jgi:hypothetical protein
MHYLSLFSVINTNHIKYLISSEPHRHFNPRRIDAEMVIHATPEWDACVAPEGRVMLTAWQRALYCVKGFRQSTTLPSSLRLV